MKRILIIVSLLCSASGCTLFPERAYQPQFHNPFPQLQKVAITPFFNQSAERSVDTRQFSEAYYNELQLVPGFEVVPVGVSETKIREYGLNMGKAADCRRLAQLLEVDAVVIGTVTDFSPYYPPRCGLKVEWYAANPGFHPIPAGYGLPWGTTQEEYIPDALRFEAEMALARAQLKTQSPDAPLEYIPPPAARRQPGAEPEGLLPGEQGQRKPITRLARTDDDGRAAPAAAKPIAPSAAKLASVAHAEVTVAVATERLPGEPASFPPNWPDSRAFVPPVPQCQRPELVVNNDPIMSHTRVYNGHDADFTLALKNYVSFRDDARFGGWQSYLQRSDDFIRFCCYKHIAEMLTARGGAGESRVVWRWPTDR